MLMSLLTKTTVQFKFMLDRKPFKIIGIMNFASLAKLSSFEILVRTKYKLVKVKRYRGLRMRRTRNLLLNVFSNQKFSCAISWRGLFVTMLSNKYHDLPLTRSILQNEFQLEMALDLPSRRTRLYGWRFSVTRRVYGFMSLRADYSNIQWRFLYFTECTYFPLLILLIVRRISLNLGLTLGSSSQQEFIIFI